MFGKRTTPVVEDVYSQRRPSAIEAIEEAKKNRKGVDDKKVTGASQITTRQSVVPVCLVTILFFLWGFAYGLLDVLNKHFQEVLGVSQGEGSGLAAAYFGSVSTSPQSRPFNLSYILTDFQSLLHRPLDILRLGRPPFWLPLDLHYRPLHLRRRCPHVLALSHQTLLWRFLRLHVHRRLRPVYARDIC